MIVGEIETHELQGEQNPTSITSDPTVSVPDQATNDGLPLHEESFTIYTFDLMGNLVSGPDE